MNEATREVHRSLARQFHGDLLRPDDTLYETARGIWNGMVARRPGLIARCADVADVQAAVRACASAEVSTAVRCGGHSLAGFSTCEGGVVIDLSKMRQITVDRAARRARSADGSLVSANARESEDLFWALRGGGGNFGVVTEFEVNLHPVSSVQLGEGLCIGDDIPTLLRRWRDYMPESPDNLRD